MIKRLTGWELLVTLSMQRATSILMQSAGYLSTCWWDADYVWYGTTGESRYYTEEKDEFVRYSETEQRQGANSGCIMEQY